MVLYQNAISFTLSFTLLVVATLALRQLKVIHSEHAPYIGKLIVAFVLPAVLIEHLAKIQINHEVLQLVLCFLLAELITFFLSYAVGKFILKLLPPSLGVFTICSTFGSTAILGTAFITAVFQGDQHILAKGLLVGQLAVGIPAYILLPLISMKSGESSIPGQGWRDRAIEFLLTPTIIAIAIGLAWSGLSLPTEGIVLNSLFEAMGFIGGSLVFLVALLVGLTLEPFPVKKYAAPILLCSIFVLIIEPLVLYAIDSFMNIESKDMEISFVLAAMPASNSIIAFAVRYKTDPKLASTLVVTTNILSAITIPVMLLLLWGN